MCECKELVHKGTCNKGFIWNPSNCESKCDKNCDIGEYLDYENCKCRKELADKLIDECAEAIDEAKLVNITYTINENNYECGSCIVYIVLMIVVIVISTGITVYLVYHNWSLIKNNTHKETLIWLVQAYKWVK